MTTLRLDTSAPPAYRAPTLDADQQAVVNHRNGALRVLAGPGTGKTTTLVAAMAQRLVVDGLSADNVLGLTFGRRAALAWRDQVARAVGGGRVPTISTFHSFCYALLRKFAPNEAYYIATRLLSGPEQQVRARTLFIDAVTEGRIAWPADLADAVGTRGLAEEIRTVMARTRTYAMDPVDLDVLAHHGGPRLWEPVAAFMDEYLDVLGFEGVLDYGELIYRAMLLCDQEEVRSYLHRRFSAVYVDEYQDTDPGQVELLKRMVTPSTTLVVVGDFDQGIYGFRGADESGIRLFHEHFADVYGTAIHDVVLRTCRRFGSNIRAAADVAIGPYQPLRINRTLVAAHRAPHCIAPSSGQVEVQLHDSQGAQAAHIADRIVREHAVAGRAWADMAVIVRSAAASMAPIYRALVAAGVPVEVASDEIPLHADPAVAVLLSALHAVNDPSGVAPHEAHALLTGPLCGIDPVDLRRLGRFLRDEQRRESSASLSSSALLARALLDSATMPSNVPQRLQATAQAVVELAQVLESARLDMARGASPHQVLWRVWEATEWPDRLQRQALGAGSASQRAHRDLDAICALFDTANRFVARGGAKGLATFLAEVMAQQIPAETLAENDVRADTVRVLTAHRAKGLEWPLVIVAGIQEDLWPNLVVPATLLQPERIARHAVSMPATAGEMLESERRLFFVAATRARDTLLLTAVHSPEREDGQRMSRFMSDVLAAGGLDEQGNALEGVDATVSVTFRALRGRPTAALSADSVVAQLRQALNDEDPDVRDAAAHRLAALVRTGLPHFRGADPANWWGSHDVTRAQQGPVTPIRLSGSVISEIEECPAKWFLERQAQATVSKEHMQLFGSALHKVAEGLATGQLELAPEPIHALIDRLWPGMGYDVPWESRAEQTAAHEAADRLLAWLLSRSVATSIVEASLECAMTVPRADGAGDIAVEVVGRADRIEIRADGAVVLDYKTGRAVATNLELARNLQLALYQLMLQTGTYGHDDQTARLDVPVVGAALVHLRASDPDQPELPVVQQVGPGAHDAARNAVPIQTRIAAAAAVVVGERYETRYEPSSCSRCPVRFLCPASPEGQPLL